MKKYNRANTKRIAGKLTSKSKNPCSPPMDSGGTALALPPCLYFRVTHAFV